ncbi:MAG: TonB family protein [Bacteroidetes bacterium]|nr:TonB family protein [Bacteroidota bacterium]
MKLIFYIFIFISVYCHSQETYSGIVYPQFPGGRIGLQTYIDENFAYPEIKKSDYFIDGTVFINLEFNREGKIKKFNLAESCGNERIDSSVLIMVSKMPNWLPALKNGEPIEYVCNYPFVIVWGMKQYREHSPDSQLKDNDLKKYCEERKRNFITGQEFYIPVNCDKLPEIIGGDKVKDSYGEKFWNDNNYLLKGKGSKTYIQYTIDTNGFVTSTNVIISGGSNMDTFTVNYYKNLPRYSPAMKNGKKIQYTTTAYYERYIEKEGANYEDNISNLECKAFDDYWYNKGAEFFEKNKLDKALYYYENSLFYNPKDIDALYNIGVIYLKMGRTKVACEYWNEIRLLGKNDKDQLIKKYCDNIALEPVKNIDTNEVFTVVEEMPQFPGGNDKLMMFIAENMNYPNEAKESGCQGKVFVKFVVGVNGVVYDKQILKSGGCSSIDKEALRVLGLMPTWTPGKQNGIPVRVAYMFPVNFQLKRGK